MADQLSAEPEARIIVIGLGNPILGDDGVGWRVVDTVEAWLLDNRALLCAYPQVTFERIGVDWLHLMERLIGYDVAIMVDAASFPGRPEGEVQSCWLDERTDFVAGPLDSIHDVSLRAALALGRRFGAALPASIYAVTIGVRRTDLFGERLSSAVAAAVPGATKAVVELLSILTATAGRASEEPCL